MLPLFYAPPAVTSDPGKISLFMMITSTACGYQCGLTHDDTAQQEKSWLVKQLERIIPSRVMSCRVASHRLEEVRA